MKLIEQLQKDFFEVSNRNLLYVSIMGDGEIVYTYNYKEADGEFTLTLSQFSHDRSDIYKIISAFEKEFKKRLSDV